MAGDINQQVVAWVRSVIGQKVGNGECWTLADRALRRAKAKSSADLGEMGDDADYVWGDPIDLQQAQAGDILQFRDYIVRTTVETTSEFGDGSTQTTSAWKEETRPHHTAIVNHTPGNGVIQILEQNAEPAGRKVQLVKLATWDSTTEKTAKKQMKNVAGKLMMATVTMVTTVKVSGTIWAYHPKP